MTNEPHVVSPYSLISDAIAEVADALERAQDSDTLALYQITLGKLYEARKWLLKSQAAFRKSCGTACPVTKDPTP